MKFSNIDKISFILIIFIFAFAFYIYSAMPERMPIHWNAKGEIDGYGNKFMGLFFLPIITVIIYSVFLFIPKIDPYKKNIESFINYFEAMKFIIIIFFISLYAISLLPNFGINFNMNYFFVPALAILFYFIGYTLKYTKRNYFIGIRTPWTLADDKVWEKTHKLGSITFRINAIILLLALINSVLFFWILIGSILLNVIFLFAYSYFEWKKIKS